MSYFGSISKVAQFSAIVLSATALSSTAAFAGCGMTCGSSHSHSSAAPSISTWSAGSDYVAPATSSYSSTSYSSKPTRYSSSASYSSNAYGASSMASNCPSGTTPQMDGTCLDTSGSYSSSASMGSSYSSRSSFTGSSYSSPSYSTMTSDAVTLPTTYSGSTTTTYASPSYSTMTSDAVTLPTTYSGSTTTSYGSSYSAPSASTYSSNSYSAPSTSSYSYSNPGSGSISATYSDTSSTVVPFTSMASVPGLGANESLIPTSCPVSVYNPGGAKVLGCYAVAKPKPIVRYTPPRVNYTRVVRPVVYVRYPVPTPVPYIQDVYVGNVHGGCGSYTRYGKRYPGSCGW